MRCDWWVSATNHACVHFSARQFLTFLATPQTHGAQPPVLTASGATANLPQLMHRPARLHSIAEHCPGCQRGNIVVSTE